MEDLRSATRQAVTNSGPQILQAPQRFVGYVTDLIDPDSVDARILYSACTDEYLAFFAEAFGKKTTTAFAEAVERGADYLHSQYVIDQGIARQVSWRIAAGLADIAGVATPSSPAPAVQSQREPEPQKVRMPVSAPPQQYPRQTVQMPGQTGSYPVPASTQEPLGWGPSTQPVQQQPYASQQPSAPIVQKKSSGKGIAIVAGMLVAGIIMAIVMVLGRSGTSTPSPTNPGNTHDTIVTDDDPGTTDTNDGTDDTAQDNGYLYDSNDDGVTDTNEPDPPEGKLKGLAFTRHDVTDSAMGAMKAFAVRNEGNTSLRVSSTSGETFIQAIGPGEEGFFLMDTSYDMLTDVQVTSTQADSVSKLCSWQETSRNSSSLVVTVWNNTDNDITFDKYFYFVSFDDGVTYWRTDWVSNSDGSEMDTLVSGENTFTISGERASVFDMSYGLYINGVKL